MKNLKSIKDKILKNTYNDFINENKNIDNALNSFINIVSNSNILKKIDTIFDNLSTNTITESLCVKYIDDNINTLNLYKNSEIINDIKLLESEFKNINTDQNELYSAISFLIENVNNNAIDLNDKIKSYEIIVENLKKEKSNELSEITNVNEEILNIAYSIHENTISELNEIEMDLYNELNENNDFEEIFNKYKNLTIENLNKLKGSYNNEKFIKTKTKLNEMKYTENNFYDDINKILILNTNIKENL